MATLPPSPLTQRALILNALKQPYELSDQSPIPEPVNTDEVLVRTEAIGLNPIDWKAPDYGFGIPQIPYISGRELVGEVVAVVETRSRVAHGDRVIVISTDYRDIRKAAYQEYVVANHFNLIRLPAGVTVEQGSALGVAATTAIIGLGICLGLDFANVAGGPDLWSLIRHIQPSRIAEDVRQESLHGIEECDRVESGDWIAIWGGSSTCAFILNQLARLAGLRTIIVLDTRKHGHTLAEVAGFQADFVVDGQDPERAIQIIRSVTQGRLRFGVDVIGRTTATYLQSCLQQRTLGMKGDQPVQTTSHGPTPPATPPTESIDRRSHLVGFTGVPKNPPSDIVCHTVPVKLFHEIPEIGESIVRWLEALLAQGQLIPPRILGVVEGLEGINAGLDRMRKGEISGGRLVARLR